MFNVGNMITWSGFVTQASAFTTLQLLDEVWPFTIFTKNTEKTRDTISNRIRCN